ncbi:unnamed protein product, partial [Rotaria magnacalcarata]
MRGKSRIDTWLRQEPIHQTQIKRTVHKPLVIHARSRIDTWNKQQYEQKLQLKK